MCYAIAKVIILYKRKETGDVSVVRNHVYVLIDFFYKKINLLLQLEDLKTKYAMIFQEWEFQNY